MNTFQAHLAGCNCGQHHGFAADSPNDELVTPGRPAATPAPAVIMAPVAASEAVARTFRLFRLGIKGGGVSASITGGELRLMKPIMPSLEFADMLKKAKYERAAEERPTFDLRILAEEDDGQIECKADRVTGLAAHTSMEDITEVLFSFKTTSVEDAEAQMYQRLHAVVGDTELTVHQLFYRTSSFAGHDFSRTGKPVGKLSYSQRLSGNADRELTTVISDAVMKAIGWGNGDSKAKYVSVWFHPDGSEKPIYANIYPKPEGYKLLAHDQVLLPPKRNVLDRVYGSKEAVADAMARYVSRHHAQKFTSVTVSFFHEQDLSIKS